ncbi:MAG: type II 3-dehydroquinate dehydratase [Gemmatimonadaceae bacterium]|nr:type II 3-dehydroquinate dehydratase [Chitinophagaceae bacterium]
MHIAIINGPNLNLLGKRETDIYGNMPFEKYLESLAALFPDVEFSYFQSNVEGEIVNEIQRIGFLTDGIVINPAAYTHTSVAIGDAIAAIKAPVVEVHISNVHAREEFRKLSHVSGKARGSIFGLGLKGYELAVRYLLTHSDLQKHPQQQRKSIVLFWLRGFSDDMQTSGGPDFKQFPFLSLSQFFFYLRL